MKPYRDIATLATVQIAVFCLLANLVPNFFLIHLYESIHYIRLLVMLFYMVDCKAYMHGMLGSVFWLELEFEPGILGRAVHGMSELRADCTANLVALGALMTAPVAVLMIVLCGRHWV